MRTVRKSKEERPKPPVSHLPPKEAMAVENSLRNYNFTFDKISVGKNRLALYKWLHGRPESFQDFKVDDYNLVTKELQYINAVFRATFFGVLGTNFFVSFYLNRFSVLWGMTKTPLMFGPFIKYFVMPYGLSLIM